MLDEQKAVHFPLPPPPLLGRCRRCAVIPFVDRAVGELHILGGFPTHGRKPNVGRNEESPATFAAGIGGDRQLRMRSRSPANRRDVVHRVLRHRKAPLSTNDEPHSRLLRLPVQETARR